MTALIPSNPHSQGPAITESRQNFADFRQLVIEDSAVQKQLKGSTDEAAFVDLVVSTGNEMGYLFNVSDVLEELKTARRSWLERWL